MQKNQVISIVGVFVLLLGLLSAVFLSKQKQEIRKKAAEPAGKLICMPLDDSGNLTNNKYSFNRIKVINQTREVVSLWVQENLCDYKGEQPKAGYVCNNFVKKYPATLNSNEEKTFILPVPDCKIGQLDVAQDDEAMGKFGPDCYNSIDNKIWEGGIAFTIKSNPNGYPNCAPSPTQPPPPTGQPPTSTPIPTATPQPTTPPGEPTYTPAPTSTPIPTAIPTQPPVGQPQPTLPVSGSSSSTIISVLGGAALLLLGLAAL